MKIDGFLEIEKKYNLYNLQIEGFNFWVYYRNNIVWKYNKKVGNLQEAHISQKKLSGKKRIMSFYKKMKYVLVNGRIPNKKGCVLVLDHPRRVMIDGVYRDIYTDELANKLENTVVFEKMYRNAHLEPTNTENLVYTDIIDYVTRWYSLLVMLFFKKRIQYIRNELKNKLYKPIQELDHFYGVKMNLDQLANEIVYCYLSYKVTKRYYKKIFKKLQPRMVIEVVSYCTECMVVNEIAEERGIPSIELQHGTMGVEHLAYNYLTNIKISQFPSYLFVFSDFWKKNMYFPIDDHHVIATGYPYLEQQYIRYAGNQCKANDNRKINILFLSSGPIAQKMEDVVVTLYNKLDTRYHIIYKLHPGEYADWSERYTRLVKLDNVEIVSDGKKNLYELFSRSDIQVSGFGSTTIFEGLYFGLNTYILNYFSVNEVDQLCMNGYAKYFDNADELYDMIMSDNQRKKTVKGLWCDNAMENMLNQIELIQKEGQI